MNVSIGSSYNQSDNSDIKWPDYVLNLENNNFNEFIQKYPLSIVEFWAPWCAPCRVMAPRLRRLSKIYKGKIAFGKLDTQKNKKIAKKYKIFSIPHLIFFINGKKIATITGLKSVGYIKNMIEEILKKFDK